jgi:sugar lactone lactonase YvrE
MAEAKAVSTFRRRLAAAAALMMLAAAPPAMAWERGQAEVFAALPAGASGPEGLTVGPDGNVYVATFGFTSAGEAPAPGQLFVYDRHGRLLRQVGVLGSSAHLLGIAFHPTTRALLVIDFGKSQVLKVDPATGSATVFITVPGEAATHGLNALTFDRAGNIYVSDSFAGVVWRTGPAGGPAAPWASDPLLTTTGTPPFGANGMAFNRAQDALFVANTGNDTVLRIPVARDSGGPTTVFANSINGADGLIIDRQDNLWVAANQADEIVVLDPSGKAIAKLGDFDGIDEDGAARGLLFPASLSFDGDWLYVTNLALDLRVIGLPPAVDSAWAAEVTRYTVSKIRARIPEIAGDDHRR